MPQGRGVAATSAYLMVDRDGGCIVIDPGIDSSANRARLVLALSAVGSDLRRVHTIVVTHLHPDHLDLAPWLAAASGGRLLMHALDVADLRRGSAARRYEAAEDWGVPAPELGRLDVSDPPIRDRRAVPAVPIADGDLLGSTGPSMRVLHTPGHTRGHVCLVLPSDRLVLTGDHVLADVHPGMGLGGSGPTNPIEAYLQSLDRLAPYDDRPAAGGGGHPGLGRAGKRREHVGRRVAAALEWRVDRADRRPTPLRITADGFVWAVRDEPGIR